jgi:hypothetical protein
MPFLGGTKGKRDMIRRTILRELVGFLTLFAAKAKADGDVAKGVDVEVKLDIEREYRLVWKGCSVAGPWEWPVERILSPRPRTIEGAVAWRDSEIASPSIDYNRLDVVLEIQERPLPQWRTISRSRAERIRR